MEQIEIALKEFGNHAIPGVETNQEVMKYFTETGFEYIHDDETPWCAAFVNWVLKQCNKEGTGKLNARSFLELGKDSKLPMIGDIVVLWRIDREGPYGHVGFFIKQDAKMIYILGGNQDSTVEIKPFPKTQLLGFRTI